MAIHKVFVSNSPNPPKIKSSSSKKANVKKAIGLITSKTQYYFINFQMSKKQGLFFFFFFGKRVSGVYKLSEIKLKIIF